MCGWKRAYVSEEEGRRSWREKKEGERRRGEREKERERVKEIECPQESV